MAYTPGEVRDGRLYVGSNALKDPTLRRPMPGESLGAMNIVPLPPQPQVNPQFTTTAPTPTPYGDFAAPDPSQLLTDPYAQFRLAEGQRGAERSAAARGTLLSGGFMRGLERYRQGVASEEGQNIFNRALSAYDTNRATNAQNFGQARGSYEDQLAAYRANQEAEQERARMALEREKFAAGQSRDALSDRLSQDRQANASLAAATQYPMDDYVQQVAAARAPVNPMAGRLPVRPRVLRYPSRPEDIMVPQSLGFR